MSHEDLLFRDATEKLKQTVRDGRTFDAAQIRLIGLDQVRHSAGANWHLIKERVRLNSLSYLTACIGKGDLVIPCGDGFLVIYTEADSRNLQAECRQLQEALNAFYLGQDGLERLRAEALPRQIAAPGIATLAAGSMEFGHDTDEKRWVRFAPVLDVHREVVSTYFATPTRQQGSIIRHGYNPHYIMTAHHDGCDFLNVDCDILDQATAATLHCLESDRPCIVGFSVHATTLQKRASRLTYLRKLAETPAGARKYLTARIAEIEPGTPLMTLAEWVSYLQTVSERVALDLHPSERSLEGLDATRAWAAGCHLPMNGPLSTPMRARFRSLITRWRLTIQRQGMRVFLDNILDPVLLTAVYGERVDFVTSEQFWPSVSLPAGIVPTKRPGFLAAA